MTKLRLYRVHSRHDTMVDIPTKTAEGDEVMGRIPCAIIELVPLDERDRNTVTLHERMPKKEDQERIAATFPVEGIVEDLGYKRVEG